MNKGTPVKIYSNRQEWSVAIGDLNTISKTKTRIRLLSKARGFKNLEQFTQLRSFWCFNVTKKDLDYVSRCPLLENLYIHGSKSDGLSHLNKLCKLKVLGLEGFSKIDRLNEISEFQGLEGLAIMNFKNVHNIEPLTMLKNLSQLTIEGGMYTRMKIDSLKSFAGFKKLTYLNLTNLKVEDESLRYLEELNQLETLEIANFFPMEEFARLSGKLRNTKCIWFSPLVELPFSECKKCKNSEMVMLTGKGKPSSCQNCDTKRIEKHVLQFDKIAASSK